MAQGRSGNGRTSVSSSQSAQRSRGESDAICRHVVDSYQRVVDGASMPAYVRMERAVHTLIAEGSLRPGQRLPTVRELAQALGITTNTAAHAYAELAAEGAVVCRAGGGTSVARADQQRQAAPPDRLRRSARHLVAYSLALGHAPAEVIHAVRAELAALGRGEPSLVDQSPEIRSGLPVHAVRTERARLDGAGMLAIEGCVRRPCSFDADQLRQLPRSELQQPFASDEGWLVPTLRWAGVKLSEVLALAEPLPEAVVVRVGAANYRMPLSMEEVRSALLADELDGAPLTVEHGAPWRLIVPGPACYASVKWVDRLEVSSRTT
jgi:DMSO/TMAO reductase YedYZ molybdopterin-dependent catalytic subunit